MFVEARERELALFSRLAEWIGCFVVGHRCSVSSRRVLEERAMESCPISVGVAVVILEQCAVCRGG